MGGRDLNVPGGSVLEVADLADLAARLGARLRAAGVSVAPERAGRFAAAVALAAPAALSELYWLGRVTLVADRPDVEAFDAVFAEVFGGLFDPAEHRGDTAGLELGGTRRAPRRETSPHEASGPRPGGGLRPAWARDAPPGEREFPDTADTDNAALVARSDLERLRHRDFAALTDDELSRLRALGRALLLAPPTRRGRRTTAGASGLLADARATLRRARRTGGEPLVLARRRRRRRPRRLVLLCDISGSMEPYARAYLQLLVSGAGAARAETFVFATRLTRLTRTLREVHPDAALALAGRLAPDWSGGTRIGAAIKAFNDGYGRRGTARGAVVVVLSDGWETGDPELLGREMARLGRLAHRVVWVNPRKASPTYEPLVRGMGAVLPYVDAFVSGHSHAALEEVLAAIGAP